MPRSRHMHTIGGYLLDALFIVEVVAIVLLIT